MITSLYELYFKNQKIYPFGTNEKGDFYELWQQHKQLKIIGMSEAWADIFYEGYIHQFQPEPTHKTSSHGTSLKWSPRPSQSAQE